MLGNCEKMILISSSSNQWPQNHQQQQIIDHNQKGLNLMASSAVIMDKPAAATASASASAPAAADQKLLQQKQQHPPESLRCPRCDSSNTKFCYYNNYSLSQPRHFCKACKRYWTKGGTLRNVPVGGGCRRNKRVVKRSNTNNSSSLPSPDSTSSSSTSCANPIPILYGNSSSDLNLPFSGYDNHHHNNLQPSLNALGLGFSNIDHNREYNLNGFSNGSFLTGYSSLFGNPSSSSLTSLLASSKFTNGGGLFKEIRSVPSPSSAQSLFGNLAAPFDHHHHHHHHHDQEFHVMGLNGGNQVGIKEVKLEEEGMMKRLEWEIGSDHAQQKNQMDQIAAPSNDPNSLYNNWSSTNWHDPSNLGSSIPSLI